MKLTTFPQPKSLNETFFWGFSAIVLLSVFGAILMDLPLLMGIPVVVLGVFLVIVDFKQVYWLLLAFVPLSIEFEIGSFGTDLPTEPLIVGLMLLFFIDRAYNKSSEHETKFSRHILIWFLAFHWLWILIAAFVSNDFVVSIKFWLAKTWYIIVFVFLTARYIRTEADFKKMFWVLLLPLGLATVYVVMKFKSLGFAFDEVNESVVPFFRNHVNYAAILALFVPFIVLAMTWYKRFSFLWFFLLGAALWMLVAIQLSYTRTAYIALILAVAAYFAFQWKLIKYVSAGAIMFMIFGISWLVQDNKYINFAPNFQKTITHNEFDDLLQATYKFQDISTMERVYRWVAGYHMVQDEWLLGFGPGNFYNYYKGYTESAFRTYVSNNPERSGIHNYFLMTFVEQGIFGLIILIAMLFAVLIKGEVIYHQTPIAKTVRRTIIMSALLSMVVIYAFLLINDMLEAAKIGAIFFINIAVLINMDLLNQSEVLAPPK